MNTVAKRIDADWWQIYRWHRHDSWHAHAHAHTHTHMCGLCDACATYHACATYISATYHACATYISAPYICATYGYICATYSAHTCASGASGASGATYAQGSICGQDETQGGCRRVRWQSRLRGRLLRCRSRLRGGGDRGWRDGDARLGREPGHGHGGPIQKQGTIQ